MSNRLRAIIERAVLRQARKADHADRRWRDMTGRPHPKCGWCTAEGYACPVHAGPWEAEA